MDIAEQKTEAHYDVYDYSTFWGGRDYEDLSDRVAVNALLRKTKARDYLVDVGAGLGRLVPCYINLYKRASVIDPSSVQLKRTEAEIGSRYPNLSFIQGVAEHLPLEDASVDTIVCVRVSHHIPHIAVAFDEYHRVLRPGGYVIMEIANKLHIKSRIKAMMHGKYKERSSEAPVSAKVTAGEDSIAFVNHNPKAIAKLFKEKGFEVMAVRSVSNFRSGFFKKIFPVRFLIFLERILQVPLAPVLFGPSIYFLARKK